MSYRYNSFDGIYDDADDNLSPEELAELQLDEDHLVAEASDEQESIEAAELAILRALDFDAMERDYEAAADLNAFQAGVL